MPAPSFGNIILVAVLGGFALCLQVSVWTLEVLIAERQHVLQQRKASHKKASARPSTSETDKASTTLRSMETTEAATLYRILNAHKPGSIAANAYWQTAVQLWLGQWDPNAAETVIPIGANNLPLNYETSERADRDLRDQGYYVPTTTHTRAPTHSDNPVPSAVVRHALEAAAEAGHAAAQFHTAVAYAAGFWAIDGDVAANMPVQESNNDPTSPWQHQAALYWQQAAIQGHVEAAMATAHRLSTAPTTGSSSSTTEAADCQAVLPFWEAAALGAVDQLELDQQSRAKVLPATDKHELYLTWKHGSSASAALEPHNRADESPEALQFYHLRVINMAGTDAAAQAAFTLAQYYHYGLRGVAQNVTLAADYYRRAATQNHWEAAGQLGKLLLWGIGVPQDVAAAHEYFSQGVPAGLYDCQTRYARLSKLKKNTEHIALCESNCLNGLALISLLGLSSPQVDVAIDVSEATAYFELAKDQGSAEAMYNLAMLRLGWWQHWKLPSAVAENGQTAVSDHVFNKDSPVNHPSITEWSTSLADLRMAAAKGHIQANARLGLLYTNGVKLPASSGKGMATVVPKDCEKATKHYKWLVDHASPDRARRMRTAYQMYVAGEYGHALRNYLVAAATGSETATLNAAFLLERGVCPGLESTVDCAKAAVRLYKAVAERGQGEACLRVGDFYYYGRLREASTQTSIPVGPFGWTRYIIFPEELWKVVEPSLRYWWDYVQDQVQMYLNNGVVTDQEEQGNKNLVEEEEDVCEADSEGVCAAKDVESSHEDEDSSKHDIQGDLEMAAHYYQLAAASKENARANFNLGFLYEWGLGLKQDFPLAKRHYDYSLAKSSQTQESDLPVIIALSALSIHDRIVQLYKLYEGWMNAQDRSQNSSDQTEENWPAPGPSHQEDIPRPSKRDKMDVIMSHIFSWDSLMVLILAILFLLLVRFGATR